MANITDSFATFLQTSGVGALGTEIFIGEAPSNETSTDGVYWVVHRNDGTSGGNFNNKMYRNVVLDIFYRDADPENVYERLEALRPILVQCNQIPGYQVIDIQPTNQFVDDSVSVEEQYFGALSINIRIRES